MVRKKKSVSKKNKLVVAPVKRHRVRENKTVMLPKPLEGIPELPEFKLDMPEEKKKQKLGFGRFFKFGKKESKTIELPKIEEPEFLREIDMEQEIKVEPELALWLNDGRVVKNVEELAKAFKTMKSRIFQQHLAKHDIIEWVRDVMENPQLAAELALAKSKKDASKIMDKHTKAENKPTVAVHNQEEQEIQKAIEKISYEPDVEVARSSPLKEREKKLEEKERLLEMEEQHLNHKRIELADKRYKLIKERGDIEKERFEKLLENQGLHEEYIHDTAGMPEMELTSDYSKEKIQQLIDDTRKALDQGQIEEAKPLVEELKTAIELTEIPAKDSKKLEYDVLELEADLKLATLV